MIVTTTVLADAIVNAPSPPVAAEIFAKNEWGDFITRSLHSDYETSYAVILSLIRWVLALMSLTIRSWYSVFLLQTPLD